MLRRLLLTAAFVTAAACSSATAPTVALDRAFTLAPGESALIDGTGVIVRFVGVASDSRCPADAICVTAGDAVVKIEAASVRGGSQDYELHTRDLAPIQHADVTIALTQLMPYPLSSRKIEPGDYRASFRVKR